MGSNPTRRTHESPENTALSAALCTNRVANARSKSRVVTRLIKLYHRTDHSESIIADRFRDGEGSYGFAHPTRAGVWVSDVPLDVNEGAEGDDVLMAEIPEQEVAELEVIGEAPYREFWVPAEVLTRHTWTEIDEEG